MTTPKQLHTLAAALEGRVYRVAAEPDSADHWWKLVTPASPAGTPMERYPVPDDDVETLSYRPVHWMLSNGYATVPKRGERGRDGHVWWRLKVTAAGEQLHRENRGRGLVGRKEAGREAASILVGLHPQEAEELRARFSNQALADGKTPRQAHDYAWRQAAKELRGRHPEQYQEIMDKLLEEALRDSAGAAADDPAWQQAWEESQGVWDRRKAVMALYRLYSDPKLKAERDRLFAQADELRPRLEDVTTRFNAALEARDVAIATLWLVHGWAPAEAYRPAGVHNTRMYAIEKLYTEPGPGGEPALKQQFRGRYPDADSARKALIEAAQQARDAKAELDELKPRRDQLIRDMAFAGCTLTQACEHLGMTSPSAKTRARQLWPSRDELSQTS